MHDYELSERTMGRILAEKARRVPDRTFLIWEGRRTSYAEVEAITNRYDHGFAAQGVRHGDHVAVMLPNVLQYPIAAVGILRAGYVLVNVNPLYTARELEHQLKDSGSEVLVILDKFANVYQLQYVSKNQSKRQSTDL